MQMQMYLPIGKQPVMGARPGRRPGPLQITGQAGQISKRLAGCGGLLRRQRMRFKADIIYAGLAGQISMAGQQCQKIQTRAKTCLSNGQMRRAVQGRIQIAAVKKYMAGFLQPAFCGKINITMLSGAQDTASKAGISGISRGTGMSSGWVMGQFM